MHATPFDEMAASYDASFTRTACATVLRARVWDRLQASFAGRERVLELGCGTGEDAIRLAQAGHQVLATDASAQMIRIAREKARCAGCAGRIDFRVLPMEELHQLPRQRPFDAVFSNFGAINCVGDLPRLAASLAARLSAASPLLFVAMGRFVPWEWAWYALQGQPLRAFRRLRRHGLEWRGLRVRYPTPGRLAREIGPWFTLRHCRALGFALPPSYAAGWLDSSPRALRVLAALDRIGERFTAPLSDHFVLEAVRAPG
jgi:SAM-dependent methyltransferase